MYIHIARLYHSQKSLPLLPSPLLCAEPLEYLRLAQEELERRLRRKINTLATQIGVPLAIEVCVCVCVDESMGISISCVELFKYGHTTIEHTLSTNTHQQHSG